MSYYGRMLKQRRNSGQVAMIVLLIMAVTLVVALSLAKGTTTEIAQTAQRAETTRIFSEAESGTEMILTNLISAMRAGDPTGSIGNLVGQPSDSIQTILLDGATESNRSDMTYSVEASQELEISLAAGESTEYRLMDFEGNPAEISDPTVKYWWASSGQPCDEQASLIIARYYLVGTEAKTEFTALNPICGGPSNNFYSANVGDAEYANFYTATYDATNTLFVRVIPVYHPTQLKIEGGSLDQQYFARTEAKNLVGEDQETQAVAASSTVLHLPSYMDYAVYSGDELVK